MVCCLVHIVTGVNLHKCCTVCPIFLPQKCSRTKVPNGGFEPTRERSVYDYISDDVRGSLPARRVAMRSHQNLHTPCAISDTSEYLPCFPLLWYDHIVLNFWSTCRSATSNLSGCRSRVFHPRWQRCRSNDPRRTLLKETLTRNPRHLDLRLRNSSKLP